VRGSIAFLLCLGCSGTPDAQLADDAGAPPNDAASLPAAGDAASPVADARADPTHDGAAPCSGVTIARVQGNGALVLSGNWSSATLGVRATRCDGAPAAGAKISFTVVSGTGVLSPDANTSPAPTLDATTDDGGLATAVFRHPSPMTNTTQSNEPGLVTATLGASRADFMVTTFNACSTVSCGAGVFWPYVQLVQPVSRDLGSVARGGKIAGAIQVQVNNATGFDNGRPVANIGVSVVNRDDATMPAAVTCDAPDGTALTGASGSATCDVRAGTTLGQQGLRIWIGEGLYYDARVTVTP
jgi:hypothetical protein